MKYQYKIETPVPLESIPAHLEKLETDGWRLFQIITGVVPVHLAGGITKPGAAQMIPVGYPVMRREAAEDNAS